MSAFGFINRSSSSSSSGSRSVTSNLSISLADDLYDSQISTFVNQTPMRRIPSRDLATTSTASSSSTNMVPFTTKNTQIEAHRQSAFTFIAKSKEPKNDHFTFKKDPKNEIEGHLRQTPLKSLLFIDEIELPSLPYNSKIPVSPVTSLHGSQLSSFGSSMNESDNEIRLLSYESAWKQTQTAKANQLQQCRRFYEELESLHQAHIVIQKEIDTSVQKESQALESEDYTLAGSLHEHLKVLRKSLDDRDELHAVNQRILHSWCTLFKLAENEIRISLKVVELRNAVNDRERLLLDQFDVDMQKANSEKQKEFAEQRRGIESKKSEIAFDLDIWKKEHTEFEEMVRNLAPEERKQKAMLEEEATQLQSAIKDLTKRLKEKQEAYQANQTKISVLDHAIKAEITKYDDSKMEFSTELREIEGREKEVTKATSELDEKQRTLYELMEQQKKSRERQEEKLNETNEYVSRSSEQMTVNAKAQDFLKALMEKIEVREMTLKRLDTPLDRIKSDIAECTKRLETTQSQATKSQKQLDELEELLLRKQSQRTSLERQKARAVDAKQFQLAAKITNDLNNGISALNEIEKLKDIRKTKVEEDDRVLKRENVCLKDLKIGYLKQKEEADEHAILVLKESKEAMQELKGSYDLENLQPFENLLDAEISTIDTHMITLQYCLGAKNPEGSVFFL